MKMYKKVRFGVVGVGGVGGGHARAIVKAASRDMSLTAVADIVPEIAQRVGEELNVPYYSSGLEMYDSGRVDAVIIATPHYWHPPLTLQAARAGLHVLCEKPLAVTVGKARAMIAECKKQKVALGSILQQRTRGIMVKMKQMVDSGALGNVFRVSMICSNWYRTQAYYDSGAWRGTWDGEGGGILLNQAPHSLDLFQWIGGMPSRIHAVLQTRAHKIEVENSANITCQYTNGKVGYIYATTSELPGMEQLMVCGDKGTLIAEGDTLRFGRLSMPISEHLRKCKSSWADDIPMPKCVWREVKYSSKLDGKHINVIRAFARHLKGLGPMVADGAESIKGLEISNAAYLAGFTDKTVNLPVAAEPIERLLTKLQRERSTGKGGDMRKQAERQMRKLMKS